MVQIRLSKGRVPNAGTPFKFWGRFRLRLRRRCLVLRPKFRDSRTKFLKDIDSGEGHGGEHFDLRKMVRREKKGLRHLAQNWVLVGTGRWCKIARSRFLLKDSEDVKTKDRVACTDCGKAEGKEDAAEKANASLQVEGKTDKRWSFNRKVGRVNIASWVTGKGKRSLTRQPLIRQESEEEEETGESRQKNEGSSKVEGCFGCTGPRMWRSKEKGRKEAEEIVTPAEDSKTDTGNVMVREEGPPALPDDLLEMCLAWTPFVSLMRARAVCKKWRSLSLSPHFLQMRERIRSQEPWLFLFGLSRDGVCLGQIQALDPVSNTWHTIKAETLTGRLLYSVTAINSAIYVIGGCSTNSSSGSTRSDKSSVRTLKTVQVYTPLTGSWRKVCPMTTERASPVVGVFKQREKRTDEGSGREIGHRVGRGHLSRVSDPYIELHSLARRRVSERGSRRGGELAVFGAEDRGERNELGFSGNWESRARICDDTLDTSWRNSRVHGRDRVAKEQKRFGLIAVGGNGKWTEQLDSAEIYDPVTDRWREIASLPADHGTPCAGVVCKNSFYVYSQSNKLAAYDLEHEYWHSIQVSHGPARLLDYTPKLVSCKDRVFLLGVAWGVVAEGGHEMATRKIWELYQEPTFIGWVKVSQHPDAPLDWNAIFVADEEKIFGVEMFKIFGQMLDFVTVCRVSGSKPMGWERVSRMQMAMQEIDPSSCLTKTAVVVHL